MPQGVTLPIARPVTGLRAGEWNTVELVLDANILRVFLNDAGGFGDARGGTGITAATGRSRCTSAARARFDSRTSGTRIFSRAWRCRRLCRADSACRRLNEFYYSWGPSVADVDRDGMQDIVAGPYYYLGPDYTTAREIYIGGTIDPGTQYFNGLQYAYDFTGDGWPDVIELGLPAARGALRESRKGVTALGQLHGDRQDDRASSCC